VPHRCSIQKIKPASLDSAHQPERRRPELQVWQQDSAGNPAIIVLGGEKGRELRAMERGITLFSASIRTRAASRKLKRGAGNMQACSPEHANSNQEASAPCLKAEK
jgi:hypothetical protein